MMKKFMTLAVAAFIGVSAAYALPTETTVWLADDVAAVQTPPAADFHKAHNAKSANALNKQSASGNANCHKKTVKAHTDAHRRALEQQNRFRK